MTGVFFRPLPLFAVVLLGVNDHFLKGSGWLPGWVTGKASDLAGMFFFPLFLAAVLSVVPRLAGRGPGLVLACAAITAAVFSLVKTSSTASAAYECVLTVLRGGGSAKNLVDPTDLVAVPMCALSVFYAQRTLRSAGRISGEGKPV